MSSDLPACDITAEQAVLGSMMISADALATCLEALAPGSFFRPAHALVFEAAAALADAGKPADPVTVKAEMERRGTLTRAGGAAYLHTLIAAVPAAASAGHYADRLLDHQAQRDVDAAAARITQIAADPGLSRQERAEAAHRALDDATGTSHHAGAVTAASVIDPFLERVESGPDTTEGILTGWADADRLLNGLRPGQLIVVGGRPGTGKSIILLNIAASAALRAGLTVLAVTLEMSRDEYMERLVASEARVSLDAIRGHCLAEGDWDRVAKARNLIVDAGMLLISDGPGVSVAGIRGELRAMRRAGRPARLVTVDYLQLLTGARRPESRQVEVSEMCRGLKLAAKEFGVPVVVGSQLNRGPEQRSDHRPLLADLRESGSLEQDSDIVILPYRDELYDESSPRAGEIDLIVAKHRQGPTGMVTLAFQGHYARITGMARPAWSPSAAAAG